MKFLSIITICLNNENVIEKTIKSVINQTYNDFEYIIIDGGSTDSTLSIIEKYRNYITRIISEPDKGIFDAQNKGIKLATGNYLLFLNSGDYLCSYKVLENVFQLMHSEDLLYGDIIFSKNKKYFYKVKTPRRITTLFMLLESLPHPCTFISKSLFDKIGLYDERYRICSDYDFFMKALFQYHCTALYLSFPISVFNLDGISSKNEKSALYKLERRRIQRQYLNKSVISKYELFKPAYIVLLKKMKYVYNLLKSITNRKYSRLNFEYFSRL